MFAQLWHILCMVMNILPVIIMMRCLSKETVMAKRINNLVKTKGVTRIATSGHGAMSALHALAVGIAADPAIKCHLTAKRYQLAILKDLLSIYEALIRGNMVGMANQLKLSEKEIKKIGLRAGNALSADALALIIRFRNAVPSDLRYQKLQLFAITSYSSFPLIELEECRGSKNVFVYNAGDTYWEGYGYVLCHGDMPGSPPSTELVHLEDNPLHHLCELECIKSPEYVDKHATKNKSNDPVKPSTMSVEGRRMGCG